MGEAKEESTSWRIGEWFPDLDPKVGDKLRAFHAEINKFNKTHNLISLKTAPVADVLHFADGILACRIIYKSNTQMSDIYDFGSGAGLPGLIFAILYPQVRVHLVENDPKKLEFLDHCLKALSISNAIIESKGIEGLPEASVDFAMSRGLASITKSLLLSRKPFKKGGVFYHIKGEEWGMEVSEIPTQLCSIWSPSLVSDYKLPVGAIKFSVIKTEKIS